MSWTQPVCVTCWFKRESFEPVRSQFPESEKCCMCGEETFSGIYIRINPATVRFPREEKI